VHSLTREITDLCLDGAMIRITALPAMHRSYDFARTAQDRAVQRHLREDLIRRFLAEFLRAGAEQIVIRKDPLGRPELEPIPGRARSQQIDFSIAHATGVLAIGASESAKIGIDIETLEEDFDFNVVMGSFFATTEREEIRAMPISDQLLGFLRGWTAKEAYVKAIGHGSAFGLDQVETASINSDTPSLRRIRGSQELAAGWKLTTRTLAIATRTVVLSVVTGAIPSPLASRDHRRPAVATENSDPEVERHHV